MVQDGENSEKKFYFCGNTIPSDFTSSSNQLEIVFKTNHRITHTGFKIRYSVVKGTEKSHLVELLRLLTPKGVFFVNLHGNIILVTKLSIINDDFLAFHLKLHIISFKNESVEHYSS